MKVLSVTSEIFPLIKTGGLADVAGSLPKAVAQHGIAKRTLIPGYPLVMRALTDPQHVLSYDNLFGNSASVLAVRHAGLDLLVLDAPALFDRPGGPYVSHDDYPYADNWKRFAALSAVGAHIASGALEGWTPDLVHAHDWHAALVPVYMRHVGKIATPTVLTIHNIAFQGQFKADIFPYLGLPPEAYSLDCLEYYGEVGFLKGGLQTASAITTVSPTYAREILTPEFGMGLDGVLNARVRDLRGIVNGIDSEIWNPETDPYLPRTFGRSNPRARRENREKLLHQFVLDDSPGPVFATVTRITWQKGMDMLVDVVDEIVDNGGKLIVLGQGERAIEDALLAAAARNRGKIGIHIGYTEEMAHLVQGGADAMIQPSRFEPCGLTQLYALRYGCIPIVARTGGLSETIIDANDAAISARVATGFQFVPITPDNLRLTLRRAMEAYNNPKIWGRLQNQAMKSDFSWASSAAQYAKLYRSLTKQ